MSDTIPYFTNESLLGNAFAAFTQTNAGTSGNLYALNQLWNPLGSGKSLVVENITPFWQSDDGTQTVYAVVPYTTSIGGSNGQIFNKKIGGRATVAQCFQNTSSTISWAAAFLVGMAAHIYQPSQINAIGQCAPFVLPPGTGITVINTLINKGYFDTTFHYCEIIV